MKVFQVVMLVVCTLLLVPDVTCWARRRRLKLVLRTREERSAYSSAEIEEQPNPDNTCLYTRKKEMCGVQMSCSCCSKPNFSSCFGGHMIGFKEGFTQIMENTVIDDDTLSTIEDDVPDQQRSNKVLEMESNSSAFSAGPLCPLHNVNMMGTDLCLPWNFLAMVDIIDIASEGKCSVILPNQCTDNLDESTQYWATFVLDNEDEGRAMKLLRLAGHECMYNHSNTQLSCIL